MVIIYNLLWYLLWPFAILRLLWRSKTDKRYRKRILERFGFVKSPPKTKGIWIHTVSVGEFLAAKPIILKLLDKYPNSSITVTTTTPTGSEQVIKHLGDKVHHVYFPYDLKCAANRFIETIDPKIALIMETELWLNVFTKVKQKNIPILLLNARLSLKSARGYAHFASLTKKLLSLVDKIATQGKADGKRFLYLGAAHENIIYAGNVKFDINFPDTISKKSQEIRKLFSSDSLIFTAASTHPKEEEQIIKTFRVLKTNFPNLKLILVPRHVDRAEQISKLCKDNAFTVVRRTEHPEEIMEDIYLADTMGELPIILASSDVVFIGGSLVPVGGHNILEPIALGIPTVVGPFMFNFAEISKKMLKENALLQINDHTELAKIITDLLNDKTLRAKLIIAGKKVIAQNKGSLDKHLEIIENIYTEPENSM